MVLPLSIRKTRESVLLRNRGIMTAEREWTYFLDADDELDENAFEDDERCIGQ